MKKSSGVKDVKDSSRKDNMNTVTFVFEPTLWNDKDGNYILETKAEAQKVADWFANQNSWKVGGDDYEKMTFEPTRAMVKQGPFRGPSEEWCIRCTFSTYETITKSMKEHLLDPDDDGNNPIKLGGKEYMCMGSTAKIV